MRGGSSGGFTLGPGGHRPPDLAQAPQIFGHSSSGTGWINWFYSKFRLAIVASQMMRGLAPQIFFPRTATGRERAVPYFWITMLATLLQGRGKWPKTSPFREVSHSFCSLLVYCFHKNWEERIFRSSWIVSKLNFDIFPLLGPFYSKTAF